MYFLILCYKLWKSKTLILKLLSLPAEYPSDHEVASAQNCLHDMRSENRCCTTGAPCLGGTFEAGLVAETET